MSSSPAAPPPPASSARSVSSAPSAYTLEREDERNSSRPGDFASSPAPKAKTKSDDDGARARARAPPSLKRAVACEPGEGAAASSAAAPAAKKQKTGVPVVGIALAALFWLGEDSFGCFASMLARGLLEIEDMYVVIATGDRHRFTKDLKKEWANEFYNKKAPHTVYRVNGNFYCDDGKLWVPKNVFVGDHSSREVEGNLVAITAREQTRAILEHMLNKKWVPTSAVNGVNWDKIRCCDNEKDLKKMAKAVALAASETQLTYLHGMLARFSQRINEQNLSNQEICRGGIEQGETPVQAMLREANEEFGIGRTTFSDEYAWNHECGHLQFQSRGKEKKEKRTALFASFFSRPFLKNDSASFFSPSSYYGTTPKGQQSKVENEHRDKIYGSLFCAHSWFKCCPHLLDTNAMQRVKAFRETRDIRLVSVKEAMKILGDPSKNALVAMDKYFKELFRGVEIPAAAAKEPASSAAGAGAGAAAAAAKEPASSAAGAGAGAAAAAKEPVIEQDRFPAGSEALKGYKITNDVLTLQGLLNEAQQKNDVEGIKWYAGLLEANKA